jgi:hypothetical protein
MTESLGVPNGTDCPSSLVAPHGTDDASSDYDYFVEQYNGVSARTSEGIVNLSKTLVLVESKFNERLQEFCGDVGLEYKGSTFRKCERSET